MRRRGDLSPGGSPSASSSADLDDAARAPVVQDLWLLLPGRPRDHRAEVDAWIEGYEVFRPIDERSLSRRRTDGEARSREHIAHRCYPYPGG